VFRATFWPFRRSSAGCVAPDRRAERQEALRAALRVAGLDGLLITHLPNIRYLTGFSGSAALLLVTGQAVTLISDFRYAAQAQTEVGSAAAVEIDQRSVWERLARILASRTINTVGVESHALTVHDAERVSSLTKARVVPTSDMVEVLRAAKSPEEVAAIRTAAVLAQEALAEVLPDIRVGQTEIEIGAALEGALRRRGSEWHPFPTIVASGPRSALPHARTSGRVVGAGELLLLDFGAQVDGYCADLTRTFIVGARADDRQRTVHGLVQSAQRRAIEHLRPGMPAREGDALARDVIASRGFGEAFGHSLGHGLGLEVHEAPRLAPTSETPLPVHAVVTVEPGIYFPGWGGIRLEDDVYLGPEGTECLSDGKTELLELV
jgi:Xaa-Pro aminopeptidase